jgi:hypothetical protein
LFAEKVIPHLRDIWSDYADDNRFWIDPMKNRAQPEPNPVKEAAE